MLTDLIDLSLNNRFLVIALFVLMADRRRVSALYIPIDAVPGYDQHAGHGAHRGAGLSPLEVEQYVTNPRRESRWAACRDLSEMRSVSKFGISSRHARLPGGDRHLSGPRSSSASGSRRPQAQLLPGHGPPELGADGDGPR